MKGIMALCDRVYTWMLYLYPAAHRRAYGPLIVQLFRDLVRDAYRQRGALGALGMSMRALWDVVVTAPAEHLHSEPAAWRNRPVKPLPWRQVLPGLVPGLLILGCRSGWIQAAFGYRVSSLAEDCVVPVVCVLLVLAGWTPGRRLAPWAAPSLGLSLFYLPTMAMDLFFRSAGTLSTPPPPVYNWLANLWPVVTSALGLLLLARRRHDLRIKPWVWLLAALLLASGPWVLFEIALLLLPFAIGLRTARRDGLLAMPLTVAAQFWLVDEIYDPSYGVYIWSSNGAVTRLLSVLPAVSFLLLVPICAWRARSAGRRLGGTLLPPLIGLFGGEIVRAAALQGSRPYSLGMWAIRGGSALQFVLILALATYFCLASKAGGDNTPIDDLELTLAGGNI